MAENEPEYILIDDDDDDDDDDDGEDKLPDQFVNILEEGVGEDPNKTSDYSDGTEWPENFSFVKNTRLQLIDTKREAVTPGWVNSRAKLPKDLDSSKGENQDTDSQGTSKDDESGSLPEDLPFMKCDNPIKRSSIWTANKLDIKLEFNVDTAVPEHTKVVGWMVGVWQRRRGVKRPGYFKFGVIVCHKVTTEGNPLIKIVYEDLTFSWFDFKKSVVRMKAREILLIKDLTVSRSNSSVGHIRYKTPQGEQCLGLMVKIWWEDDTCFYVGKVIEYTPNDIPDKPGKIKVQYFDNQIEVLCEDSPRIFWQRKDMSVAAVAKRLSITDKLHERKSWRVAIYKNDLGIAPVHYGKCIAVAGIHVLVELDSGERLPVDTEKDIVHWLRGQMTSEVRCAECCGWHVQILNSKLGKFKPGFIKDASADGMLTVKFEDDTEQKCHLKNSFIKWMKHSKSLSTPRLFGQHPLFSAYGYIGMRVGILKGYPLEFNLGVVVGEERAKQGFAYEILYDTGDLEKIPPGTYIEWLGEAGIFDPERTNHLPMFLPIVCRKERAVLLTSRNIVLFQGECLSPSFFESLCGSGSAKKWKSSIRIWREKEEMQDEDSLQIIGDWLALVGDCKSLRTVNHHIANSHKNVQNLLSNF